MLSKHIALFLPFMCFEWLKYLVTFCYQKIWWYFVCSQIEVYMTHIAVKIDNTAGLWPKQLDF